MRSILRTPVCDIFGCDVPIVLAGMGGVARSELVAAVSEAGGFGFLGMVRETPDFIRAEIARVRERTSRNFGVNLIPAATEAELLEAELDAVIAANIPVVSLFWDMRPDIVARLRKAGCVVVCQVGSANEAAEAELAGANVLIAQGIEAGGHVRSKQSLDDLLPQVLEHVRLPVLAAGGIVDGKGVAAALVAGAQGVSIGTAFLATEESFAHESHKWRIIASVPGETVYTEAFHINWPIHAPVRVLPNSATRGEHGDPYSGSRKIIGHEGKRPIYLFSTDSPLQNMTGDLEAMAQYAGAGAGLVDSRSSASGRLKSIVVEAERLLRFVDDGSTDDVASIELSSPACSIREADSVYMGYVTETEILSFLDELLEAERAGVRITRESARAIDDNAISDLLLAIQRDASRWCAMLFKQIKARGEIPSPKTGAFYGKAMTIRDIAQRIELLNRGQRWVARKLREMLPRVRDDQLYSDFAEMLHSHEGNIALAAKATSSGAQ